MLKCKAQCDRVGIGRSYTRSAVGAASNAGAHRAPHAPAVPQCASKSRAFEPWLESLFTGRLLGLNFGRIGLRQVAFEIQTAAESAHILRAHILILKCAQHSALHNSNKLDSPIACGVIDLMRCGILPRAHASYFADASDIRPQPFPARYARARASVSRAATRTWTWT